MQIVVDDLSGAEIAEFLQQHIDDMRAISPPESKHALDLNGLRQPEITFWTVWSDGLLAGCGALKALSDSTGEIKSMRTAAAFRGRGVASNLLRHIVHTASERGYRQLNLETGAMDFFAPARQMYAKFGFIPCRPFADYREDPNSVFMQKNLTSNVRA